MMTLQSFRQQHKGGELMGIIIAKKAMCEHHPTATHGTNVSNIYTGVFHMC